MITKIILAEFFYSRFVKFSIGPILAIIAYKYFMAPGRMNGIIAILIFNPILSLYIIWVKEKRERVLSLLPLKPLQIALVRILIVFIPFILIYSTLLILMTDTTFANSTWDESIAELLMFMGLTLLGSASYFAFRDFISDYDRTDKIITSIIASIAAMVLVVAAAVVTVETYELNLITGYIFVLGIILSGIVLQYFTVKTFKTRKSYLS